MQHTPQNLSSNSAHRMSPHHNHAGHNQHNTNNHGHGHSHHSGCMHHQIQVSPEEYFQKIEQMKTKEQKQLYWMQILKGTYFDKKAQKMGLNIVSSLNCQFLTGIVGMFHMMMNCQWVPNMARSFISGLFWILVFLIIIDTNILSIQHELSVKLIVFYLPLILYVFVAIRGTGSHISSQNLQKAKKAFSIRPYLQNPALKCPQCKIPKAFRSMHCPICKVCIPKFSRHSLVFGTCIGGANQLLAMFFFLSISIMSIVGLYNFWYEQKYGLLTKIMFYGIHIYLSWASFTEFCTFLIMNINFGVTQFQVQSWMMMQYMMKIPQRQFKNNMNQGFCHNLKQSLYALFGISGYQSQNLNRRVVSDAEQSPLNQQINNDDQLGFPQLDQNKKYTVNWAKAYFFLIPEIPNHPSRKHIIQMMKIQEPRMIQNFRMMSQFKQQTKKQYPNLNQMQIQQRAMFKMQEYVLKRGPPSHMKPAPQQQRVIQLQMLAHLKQQFINDKQINGELVQIQQNLKNQKISSDDAALKLREVQQTILQKKMTQVLAQQQKMIAEQNEHKQSKQIKKLVKQEQYPSKQETPNRSIVPQIKQQQQIKVTQKTNVVHNNPQQMPRMVHPMMMQNPLSLQQQKNMFLSSINNIKIQFSSHQNIIAHVSKVQNGLQDNSMSIQEAKIMMTQIQPQLMQIKMKQMSQRGGGMPQPPMMPSPQQQKMMMIMGINNMKQQFKNDKSILEKLQQLQSGLKSGDMDINQGKMMMMELQRMMMQRQMQRHNNTAEISTNLQNQ